jgi:hypothetical protein
MKMETKLWRIVHLSTSENYDDTGRWDEMYAEECAIVECTEEQVKEMCEKCIPISNEDEHIFNKFVYFEVHPNTDFDPMEWMSKRNDLQHTMPVDVYKQLSSGYIEGYCDDDGWTRFFVVPNWDYKEQLASYGRFYPEMIANWNYIKGGNDNA